MRGDIISLRLSPIKLPSKTDGKFKGQTASIRLRSVYGTLLNLTVSPTRFQLSDGTVSLVFPKIECSNKHFSIKSSIDDGGSYLASEEDDELCPVECVREFQTDEELFEVLEKGRKNNALIVVDFYRTSCGSCKYIEQGFAKLCKASGDDDSPVIFLKHNVLDEYDEQSETADRLRIKTVPLFHFYKNGALLEAFATRDKERITEAILKYTSPARTTQDA